MNRFAIASALLVFSVGAQAAGVGDVFGALMGRSDHTGNGGSLDETLTRVTAQMNSKTPMAVDKETRLDRVTAESGARLAYHYTLVNKRNGDVNPSEFVKAIKPQLKSKLCASKEMQNFLRNGVSVSYLYRTSDGQAVGGAEFTPSDCGYKT